MRYAALEKLSGERVLEVTVWDYDMGSSNDFIGGLRLGPAPGHAAKHSDWMDSTVEEVSHWEAMLKSHVAGEEKLIIVCLNLLQT